MIWVRVLKKMKKAVKLYEKAIEQGIYMGYNNLGCCYRDGSGVEQNYTKALECFQRAAEKGISLAFRNIGDLYKEGKGVKKNLTKAFEYFKKQQTKAYHLLMMILETVMKMELVSK